MASNLLSDSNRETSSQDSGVHMDNDAHRQTLDAPLPQISMMQHKDQHRDQPMVRRDQPMVCRDQPLLHQHRDQPVVRRDQPLLHQHRDQPVVRRDQPLLHQHRDQPVVRRDQPLLHQHRDQPVVRRDQPYRNDKKTDFNPVAVNNGNEVRAVRRRQWGEDKPLNFLTRQKEGLKETQDHGNSPLSLNKNGSSRILRINKSDAAQFYLASSRYSPLTSGKRTGEKVGFGSSAPRFTGTDIHPSPIHPLPVPRGGVNPSADGTKHNLPSWLMTGKGTVYKIR